MAKINDYFLKAIFNEKDVDIEEKSVTVGVRKMSQYVIPTLIQEDKGDFDLYYTVKLNDLQKADIDESQALELRQCGWILDESGENVIKKL